MEKCCVRLDPKDWDKKNFKWEDKPFYKTKYYSLMHIPLTYGGAVKKADKAIRDRGLATDIMMGLSKEESAFKSTLLISMEDATDDLPVEKLSGNFYSRLFEGDYKDTGKWVGEMKDSLKSQGKEAKELLFWYVTCPKCAKEYGSAQTVIFART